MIEIDKDIPVPEQKPGGGARKYPWLEMDVGDSFIFPDKRANAHANAWHASIRYGRKFSVRRTPEGLRIWRIS